MKVRLALIFVGLGTFEAGLFLVYRPLCLISIGALLLLIAARGGKG